MEEEQIQEEDEPEMGVNMNNEMIQIIHTVQIGQ